MAQTSMPMPAKPLRFADTKLFYRIFEIIPGTITWSIILGPIIFSFIYPIGVAYFIIAFDLYWLLKSIRMSFSLLMGYKVTRETERIDWQDRLLELTDVKSALKHALHRLAAAQERGASRVYQKKAYSRGRKATITL